MHLPSTQCSLSSAVFQRRMMSARQHVYQIFLRLSELKVLEELHSLTILSQFKLAVG